MAARAPGGLALEDAPTPEEFGDQKVVKDNPEVANLWDHPIMGAALKRSQNQGLLVCSEDPPQIVVVPYRTPWLRAFDLSGTLMWTTELEDYKRLHWVSSGGGTTVSMGP